MFKKISNNKKETAFSVKSIIESRNRIKKIKMGRKEKRIHLFSYSYCV